MSLSLLISDPPSPQRVWHYPLRARVRQARRGRIHTHPVLQPCWHALPLLKRLAHVERAHGPRTRCVYSALHVPGGELPPGRQGKSYIAHISVMRPEEILELGGEDKVTERGKQFHYSLGPSRRRSSPRTGRRLRRCTPLPYTLLSYKSSGDRTVSPPSPTREGMRFT